MEARDRSMADVVKDIIGNVQDMIRSEVRLAKAELREETTRTLGGAKMLGVAAGLGFFAGAFLLTGIALLLALVMPAWMATLLMAVVLGAPAAILFAKGRSQLTVPTPTKTIDNVKENVEWMKNQTKS
jgi:uncharacterized membrane protein YqjE